MDHSAAVEKRKAMKSLAGVAFLATGLLLARQTARAQIVTTFAGSGAWGSVDASGAEASSSDPSGVAVDSSGNVYVADRGNHKIRKITPSGAVTTLAGSGQVGGADGMGAVASFHFPTSVAVDASGNVYVTSNPSGLRGDTRTRTSGRSRRAEMSRRWPPWNRT
jgi:hypothetical protein